MYPVYAYAIRQFARVLIAVSFVTLGAGKASAFSIISVDFESLLNIQVPVTLQGGGQNQDVPVNVTFQESDTHFVLTVTTNSIFDPDEDWKFDITHTEKWDIALTFNYFNALFEDESVFELTGTALHDVRPAVEGHLNDAEEGFPFSVSFPSFGLEPNLTDPRWRNNTIQFKNPDRDVRHPPHVDDYHTNDLRLTRSASDFDELSSFHYELAATHVPEPSLPVLLITGLLGLSVYRSHVTRNKWRRKKSQLPQRAIVKSGV